MNLFIRSICFLLFAAHVTVAQIPCNVGAPYKCTDININSLVGSANNNGAINNLYWPNDGSNKRIFTECNLMIGAMIDTNIAFAVGYGVSSSDYRPGMVLPDGTADTNKAIWPTTYRVFRIARNWEKMREGNVKETYRKDLNEWPDTLGAPLDAKGKPLFVGDVTTWSIWNDADSLPSSFNPARSVPLHAEIQQLTWAYEKDPILQNVIFVKYTIINKGKKLWKKFCVGNYLLGGIANSITNAGTDSVLELQYLYSKATSTIIYGSRTPSFGFVQLQGPVVPKPGRNAFNFGRTIDNAENLHALSAATYPSSLPFNERLYTSLLGIDPFTNNLYVDPTTGKSSRFSYTGDPASGTGWNELSYPPRLQTSQRELMLSNGPIDVQPNDTVTIVGALITAQGKDHLHSVTIMKHFARYLRTNYISLLSPFAYPTPVASSSVLSGKVVLTWETNAEHDLVNGYKFQAYNLYQGESPAGPWHKIFTADKTDSITALYEETYQPEFSTLASGGIQSLPNVGIQNHFIAVRDSINSVPLIDGRPYYFSVRAVWESSNNRPMTTESPDIPITAIPERAVPGTQIVEPYSLIQHTRVHDDALLVEVVNPLKLKDNTFHVVVHNQHDTITWDLVNDVTHSPVFLNLKTTAGESTPIIDGFTLRLKKQLEGVRRDIQNPRGWEYAPEKNRWISGASTALLMDGFSNGLVYPTINNFYGRGGSRTKANQLQRTELRFSNTVRQKAYRYVDKVRGFPFNDPPKNAAFAPFIIKRGGGFVYQDYVDVPFTAWEIDSLDGDLTPRQLSVGFVENNDSLTSVSGKYLGNGNVDGKWEPTKSSTGGNELLYIFSSSYVQTPDPHYTQQSINLFFNPDSFDVMYVLSAKTDTVLKKILPYSFQEGDVFRITPNYQFSDGQIYSFSSSPGVIGSRTLAFEQKAMEKITVFPNPYLGGNSLEQSPSQRFVRILNLPAPSTIRIFNLSGRMVRIFEHTNPLTGYSDWDLRNDEGIKVASGLYVIHIDSPGIGSKILKLVVLYPDERLNAY